MKKLEVKYLEVENKNKEVENKINALEEFVGLKKKT